VSYSQDLPGARRFRGVPSETQRRLKSTLRDDAKKNRIRTALSVCSGVHIMLIDWKRGEFIADLAVSYGDSDVSMV